LSVQERRRSGLGRFKKISELISRARDCYDLYIEIRSILHRFGLISIGSTTTDIFRMAISFTLATRKKVKTNPIPDDVSKELKECIDALETLNYIYNKLSRREYEEIFSIIRPRKTIEEEEIEEEIASEKVDMIIEKFKKKRGII